ncbi:MAG: hypothetical protein EPN23_06605 [Verrucomicrobia bacterium]|nr:MAG: hypothetical protein EPN23_06605 [Verrucomicrobiota bacterium]
MPSLATTSFLAIHPNQRFLYAAGKTGKGDGRKTGSISAFAIQPQSGKLKLLNQESAGGAGVWRYCRSGRMVRWAAPRRWYRTAAPA